MSTMSRICYQAMKGWSWKQKNLLWRWFDRTLALDVSRQSDALLIWVDWVSVFSKRWKDETSFPQLQIAKGFKTFVKFGSGNERITLYKIPRYTFQPPVQWK